ncbi:MAG TPA: flagellar hook-basal body complex protein FliE [Firmicutes bacterium]|nr:flagellar hook-basal body complex protein FliE [Candidatus Fermentithermobacillaceae bacterium]
MYIRPVGTIKTLGTLPLTPPRSTGTSAAAPAESFQDTLRRAVSSLEEMDRELLKSNIELVAGTAKDMHSAVLAAEKASLALDLIIAIRNKAIEAYQEIMRMPI